MKVVSAIALAAALLLGLSGRTAAAPDAVHVAPMLAPSGTTVSISGNGCTSPATVSSAGFLFPAPPTAPVQLSVVPEPTGSWGASFPMPAVPTYLVVECDGVSSAPIVIAPSDVDVGSLAVGTISDTDVEIRTSPLVDDSSFSIFTAAGNLLGTDVVDVGVGAVVVPRSLGPATITAIGLRQPDSVIPLPYIPIARRVQLPLAGPTTLIVEPHVAPHEAWMMARGTCQGRAQLVVSGRPNGWYDVPPISVDVVPTVGPDGAWTHQFATPVLPSTAMVTCSRGSVTDSASVLIAPTSGDIPALTPLIDGTDIVTDLPPTALHDTLRAYAAAGEPLPLVVDGTTLRIDVRSIPTPVVMLVGIESLGENADALQVTRPQAWQMTLPPRAQPATITVTPTTTVLPGAPSTTAGASPPSGQLPPTGRADATLIAAAALVLGLGFVARRIARRPW